MAAGTIDYVIVHKLDRFARNRVDDAVMSMALTKAGARLVSCSENIDDTPSGALLHGIMASISEFYSKNLATEVKKGFAQKVKAGGTPTRAKLGYLNARELTPDGRNIGIINVDPERAPLIRLGFELYATGDYSFSTLIDVLAAKGLRTRPTRKHQGLPLTTSQIDRILKDPYYIGIVRYKGVEYPGAHTAIVDEDLFFRVQDIITAHSMSGDKRRLHHHWLKGTVHCGECGKRLIYTRARNRHGTTYEYFYCVGRQHYDRSCQQGWMTSMPSRTPSSPITRPSSSGPCGRPRSGRTSSRGSKHLSEPPTSSATNSRPRSTASKPSNYASSRPTGRSGLAEALAAEQARLKADMRAAEAALRSTQLKFEDIRTTFGRALDPASDCHGPMSPPRRKSDACSTSCSSSASWSKPATARPASAARPSLACSAPS